MPDRRDATILGLSVALAFCAGALLAGDPRPAEAQQKPGVYGDATVDANRRYVAATGSVGSGMSVLWLLDTETQRLLVYGTSNLGKSVELRAARKIEWDLRLTGYRDESQYTPEELEAYWRKKQSQPGQTQPDPGSGDPPADRGTGDGSDK